nr:LapD/MoxY N-terminal periplasmic domain-containing protein [Bradyrhizobium sp.]
MRLIALFALVLILGLAINIGRLLLEAGPRVQAEDESVIRLAREFIEASVGDLRDSEDPEAKLAAVVDGLQRLRHVTVTREGEAPKAGEELAGATVADGGVDAPPAWFIALVRPEQATQSVPIVVQGKSLGSLVIASHPTDEIAEIWDGIVTQVGIGSALAVALFLVTIV